MDTSVTGYAMWFPIDPKRSLVAAPKLLVESEDAHIHLCQGSLKAQLKYRGHIANYVKTKTTEI